METLLSVLLPGMLGAEISFSLHDFGGKQALLKRLEGRLTGYASWIGDDYKIIVVVDEDREDCTALKSQICSAIDSAGLSHKSTVVAGVNYQCAVRLAVEELEAWIFGDCAALRAAYARVPAGLETQAAYRDPDRITGGTWEQLERVLKRAGYFEGGMPKMEVAAAVAPHMDIWRNRSKSFAVFRDLILSL